MTTLLLAAREKFLASTLPLRRGGVTRLLALMAFLGALLLHPTLRPLLVDAMSEAYLAVGVFVAATFAIFFAIEHLFRIDVSDVLERHRAWELPFAAGMGALPGCGGAVMIITQYAMGRASFGAVVAALTATMGDAAFLLLARQPLVAMGIMACGLVAGWLFGGIINRIHGRDFLRVEPAVVFEADEDDERLPVWMTALWTAILIPSFVIACMQLMQLDVDAMLFSFADRQGMSVVLLLGFFGALVSLMMWALSRSQADTMKVQDSEPVPLWERVAVNTNFVTIWVIGGFLAYELLVVYGGVDVSTLSGTWPALMPLFGAMIGFLPGCGPQIVVTTLYLGGAIPFSAQLSNALSNDGDALFPAIAISPRAALVATLYTAIPALILGYAYMLAFE